MAPERTVEHDGEEHSGYDRMPLLTIDADGQRLMVLPADDQFLADEAFLVVDTAACCDLRERR